MRRSWQFENQADGGSDGRDVDQFRVEIAPDRDVVRVSPVGELDMSTTGELTAEIQQLWRSGFTRVILDLRGATFIDSSGLHAILDEHAAATADGRDFAIIPGPPAVQRIFAVTGLKSRLPFLDGATGNNGATPSRRPH
jgi:anti-sigma B factor antagonist